MTSKVRKTRRDSMKGITIKSGLKRPTDKGAGLSEKAVKIINRRTGGNLKTAVTEQDLDEIIEKHLKNGKKVHKWHDNLQRNNKSY